MMKAIMLKVDRKDIAHTQVDSTIKIQSPYTHNTTNLLLRNRITLFHHLEVLLLHQELVEVLVVVFPVVHDQVVQSAFLMVPRLVMALCEPILCKLSVLMRCLHILFQSVMA